MHDLPSPLLLEAVARRDPAAEAELFRRYAARLVALARPRLSRSLAARVDPEDVAASAWRSFFTLVHSGGVTVGDGGLWPLLARVTLRKLARAARRHSAGQRSMDKEEPLFDLPSRDPGPAEAAALLDELRSALEPLDPLQRRIVELRLEGRDPEEIGPLVERSARTVRRVLSSIEEELGRRLLDLPAPEGGMEWGDIVLLKQIGEGGMGKVYRTRHRRTGEEMAVKLLRKPLRSHTVAASRFMEEARILARLQHPHIIGVKGAGSLPDGGLFVAMELADGTLAGQTDRPSILRWLAEAAEGLAHAHAAGVVHGDVKPSNILLRCGRALVADFGMAGLHGGTAGFMAPEAEKGPKSDVYGLGATMRGLLGDIPPALIADDPDDRPTMAEAGRLIR